MSMADFNLSTVDVLDIDVNSAARIVLATTVVNGGSPTKLLVSRLPSGPFGGM